MILECQRAKFDIPRDVCYLNAAYMTPLTRKQQEIANRAVAQSGQPWTVGPSDFFPASEKIREYSAEIMNVSVGDVAIIPAVSYGMATAARNLPFSRHAKTLVLEAQFPSNVYEWMSVAEQNEGSVHTVETPADDNWTEAILEALASVDGIEIVALPHVHWASGVLIDLVRVSRECKKIGAALVLDLTQSIGAAPIDLRAVDPDFAVMGGYKWMLGPYSLGVMYVAPRWQDGKPLEQNWISRADSEDFAGLVNYKDAYQPGARRFDVGERSNFILSPIYVEGLRQLLEWGVGNIAETLKATNARLAEVVQEYGFEPVSDKFRSDHMMGVHVGERGPQVLEKLQAASVSASVRGDMLRVAPHLWVDDEDIHTFANALRAL